MAAPNRAELKRARYVAPLASRHRVKRARQIHGWTQTELAQRTEGALTSGAISQLEAGKTRPTAPTLVALSNATGHPLEYFAGHRGDVDAVAFFRSLRSAPKRERDRALAWAHLLHDLTVTIEGHLVLPELALPQFAVDEDTNREDIEGLAEEVRRQWGLGAGPIGNVINELERHGLIAASLPLDRPDLDAFSVDFDERPVVILGADKRVAARTRFDAAHELGHLVMHSPEVAGTKAAETQAHQFAAGFLMPRDSLIADLPRSPDWRRLLRLKVEWGASMQALLMRARTLGRMDQHQYVRAMKQISARGWRREEPGDDQLGAPERPTLLGRAVRQLGEEGLNLGDLASEAGLPLVELQSLLTVTADHRARLEF